MDDKIRMLSCFDFASKAVDYVQSTKGLNMYTGCLAPSAGTPGLF